MDVSKILSTTFSPKTVGNVATRRSIFFPPTFIEILPSCGTRFSAMLRSAITFMRLIRPFWMFLGAGGIGSIKTPSTRKRIRRSCSRGSIWTSEARSATAWVITALTSLTIGASSTAASRSLSSSSSPAASTMLAIASTPESMPECFWIAASTSAAVATTGNTSRPVIVRISSRA